MKPLQVDRAGATFVLVWASGYLVGSIASEHIAPLAANLWRFVIGAAVLAVIAGRRREAWPRGPGELTLVAGLGVLMFAVQFGGLYTGMAEGTPAGTTALIACSSPLLVAAASHALGWDRLSPRRWLGIGVGATGVLLTLSDRVGRPPTASALGWTLLGLIGLAGGTLLQGRLRIQVGPAALASVELTAAAAVMAVWAPLSGSLTVPVTGVAIGSLAWITVVAGIGGPLLYFTLIKQRGATRASSLLFLVPAVTALAAWPVLGVPVAATTVPGLALAGFGLWLARGVSRAGRSGPRPARSGPRSATNVPRSRRSLGGGGAGAARSRRAGCAAAAGPSLPAPTALAAELTRQPARAE
jgi:drug/metabolite transporter (DMT)-like permease